MIELTQVDPTSHRYDYWKVSILLDQVTHVAEYTAARGNGAKSIIYFANGKYIHVTESIQTVTSMIRKYAEDAQCERVAKMVADEIARQFPEMADKAWRCDDNSD